MVLPRAIHKRTITINLKNVYFMVARAPPGFGRALKTQAMSGASGT